MFFSFSLFPPGISARCSRSAFPPGVSARRLGLRYRLLFPVCVPARHFPPAGLGSRSVSALRLPLGACPFLPAFLPCGPSPRFRPAFPPGVWVCATACYSRSAFPPGISARRLGLRYRLLFPVCVSARHFPPAGLGSRSVSALRLPLGACPLLHGLFSACGYFRIRQKTRLPESGRWLAALRRLPPGPFFRTGRRLRQRRNPRRTGCKVTYNSLIIAAFTIYSQFLQQRLRSP